MVMGALEEGAMPGAPEYSSVSTLAPRGRLLKSMVKFPFPFVSCTVFKRCLPRVSVTDPEIGSEELRTVTRPVNVTSVPTWTVLGRPAWALMLLVKLAKQR